MMVRVKKSANCHFSREGDISKSIWVSRSHDKYNCKTSLKILPVSTISFITITTITQPITDLGHSYF
jgi:hypothetical protein